MIGVVSAGVGDIVQYLLARQAVSVRHGQKSHRSECSFSINIQTLPLPTTHIKRQLTCHGKGMADLGFSSPELAEDFCDGARFDATSEQGVELFGASGDRDELGAALVHFGCRRKAHGDEFGCCEAGQGLVRCWIRWE